MIQRLSRRVPRQDREPADSLLHRLATRWGMPRDGFERFVGLAPSQMRRGTHAGPLASMAGLDAAALTAATPRREPGSRRIVVGRAWTDLSDVAGRRVRVCGACLEEDRQNAAEGGCPIELAAWCRPEWSVASVATCVRHGALLASECTACGKVLDGLNPAIDVCVCGAPVTAAAGVRFEGGVDALLVDIIAGAADVALVADAGLHQVSAHLTRLGAAARGWSQERPEAAGVDLLRMREAGLDLARGGEKAVSDLCDDLLSRSGPGRCGRVGLTSGYGWVWRSWLGVPTPNPLDVRLRVSVLRHAEKAGIRSRRESRDVTLAQAGAILGSGHERTRRIVAGAGMLRGGELPGVAMSLDETGISQVAVAIAGLLDATAAAAAVGVSRHRFVGIARAGLVAADARAAAVEAGVLYSPDALQSLVDVVSGDAPILDRPPVGCVPVPRACRDASVPLVTVLAAMLEGRVRAVARTVAGGLGGVWVSVTEVRRLATPAMSVRATARRLGLHYEAARWLAAQGVLGPAPGEVDEVGVQAFDRSFCTSAQAGATLGVPSKVAAARLRAAGEVPAFGPPACRQAIWRRGALGGAGRLQ